MEYKVGDKVRIKSLDWYNENKNEYGNVKCHLYEFSATMRQYCGTIRTIRRVDNFDKMYKMEEDGCFFDWTDEMIEGLVEEETKPKMVNLNKACEWLKENIWIYINYEGCSGEELENDVIEDFRKAMEEYRYGNN